MQTKKLRFSKKEISENYFNGRENQLSAVSLLANVADTKSLVIHPASTTHSQCTPEELLEQGIKPNTIRLSVGIENGEDLIAALEAAFRDVPY